MKSYGIPGRKMNDWKKWKRCAALVVTVVTMAILEVVYCEEIIEFLRSLGKFKK